MIKGSVNELQPRFREQKHSENGFIVFQLTRRLRIGARLHPLDHFLDTV